MKVRSSGLSCAIRVSLMVLRSLDYRSADFCELDSARIVGSPLNPAELASCLVRLRDRSRERENHGRVKAYAVVPASGLDPFIEDRLYFLADDGDPLVREGDALRVKLSCRDGFRD